MNSRSRSSNTPWVFSATVYGWGEGGDFTSQHLALNRLFERYAPRPYCAEVQKFYFNFQVGGSLQDVKTEGPYGLRILRPKKYISQTVGVPAHRWQTSAFDLAVYIADCVLFGAESIHRKLRESKITYDVSRLDRDLERVMSRFMAREWPASVETAKQRHDVFVQRAKDVLESARGH